MGWHPPGIYGAPMEKSQNKILRPAENAGLVMIRPEHLANTISINHFCEKPFLSVPH